MEVDEQVRIMEAQIHSEEANFSKEARDIVRSRSVCTLKKSANLICC